MSRYKAGTGVRAPGTHYHATPAWSREEINVKNGPEHNDKVDLWHCPCKACTRLDWEASLDDGQTLREWRVEMWPEFYTA